MNRKITLLYVLIIVAGFLLQGVFSQPAEEEKPYSEMSDEDKTTYLQETLGIWGGDSKTVEYDESTGEVIIGSGADVVLESSDVAEDVETMEKRKKLTYILKDGAEADVTSFKGTLKGKGTIYALNGDVVLEGGEVIIDDGDFWIPPSEDEFGGGAEFGEGSGINGVPVKGFVNEYNPYTKTLIATGDFKTGDIESHSNSKVDIDLTKLRFSGEDVFITSNGEKFKLDFGLVKFDSEGFIEGLDEDTSLTHYLDDGDLTKSTVSEGSEYYSMEGSCENVPSNCINNKEDGFFANVDFGRNIYDFVSEVPKHILKIFHDSEIGVGYQGDSRGLGGIEAKFMGDGYGLGFSTVDYIADREPVLLGRLKKEISAGWSFEGNPKVRVEVLFDPEKKELAGGWVGLTWYVDWLGE